MVSPYRDMVYGVFGEEKSLEGRIIDLTDDYNDIHECLNQAFIKENNSEKKLELQKALIYLQDRITKL